MQRSCENISEILVDYADGQLSPGESSEVAAHLAKCEQCQRTLQALQRSLELAGVIWEDGLAETEAIRAPIQQKARKIRWPGYAAAAAGIILLLTTSIVWHALIRPAKNEINFAEIERRIVESGSAARLLAAADLLAKYPDAATIVKKQYSYIVETYPQTPAAAEAKSKIQ